MKDEKKDEIFFRFPLTEVKDEGEVEVKA